MKPKDTGRVLEDEEILDLYFARQECAIIETDKKYCQYLHAIAYNILHNEQDTEECLQDTYLRTWNTIPPQRPQIFHAFLAKITRNLSLNRQRAAGRAKRRAQEECLPLDEVQAFVPDSQELLQQMESAAIARIITEYLDVAPDRRMYVFVARYFFSLTVGQIAKRLDCSASLVNKELAKIRQELRSLLEKEGIDV